MLELPNIEVMDEFCVSKSKFSELLKASNIYVFNSLFKTPYQSFFFIKVK
ncbi:hypothetical protein [Campylobacter pinnipediorum]|nr:hypothetical protein [Campylobacter pinnipediorum]